MTPKLKVDRNEDSISPIIELPIVRPTPVRVKFPLFNIRDKCPICKKLVMNLTDHAKEQMDPEHVIYLINNT